MRTLLLAGLSLLTTASFAADFPELVLPQGVGVNIHFNRGHEKDLDMIATAGCKWVRMDLGWSGIERKRGEYNWSAYDELTTNLEKRGLRALYILDYSNPLYEDTVVSKNPITGREHKDIASPQKPESVAAFARWAAAAAERYRGRRVIWEIWNEPNISFWKPKPDVRQYNTLALATCQAIRRADPQATIVAPATSEFPWAFLEAFFQSGILQYLDAISVHPYRNYSKAPETAAPDYQKLRGLIERYAPAPEKRAMPILSGEWGYSTHAKGVSLQKQADFLVRQQLVNVLHGVPLSIWYDWKNDGPDAAEREHNFGTVTAGLEPKPAYVALQTMTRTLAQCRIIRRLEQPSEQDYVLLLAQADGAQKLALWTMGEPHAITFDLPGSAAGVARGVAGNGDSFEATVENRNVTVQVTQSPRYLALK